jgi:hypothetical protein
VFSFGLQSQGEGAIVSWQVFGSTALTCAVNVVTLPLPCGPALPRPDRPFCLGKGVPIA